MKRFLLILISVFFVFSGFAQESTKPKIDVKPYGFVAYEAIFDTYKSLDVRDGELTFYPLKPNYDANGNDINKKVQFQMLSIITRFGIKVSGPDILGAKSSARFESDFYATANSYIYLLRLRHAFINLKWENAELIMGQYWHPVIVNEFIPSTISFGAGQPFHSLNRSPQIRFIYHPSSNIRMLIAAVSQGYHRTKGPEDAMRNSGRPEVLGQIAYGSAKKIMIGASAGYKWLTPRLVTASGLKTDKTIGQYLFSGFASVANEKTSIRTEVIYGENLTHLVMIGGYGRVTESDPNGDYDYANLRTFSTWVDVKHKLSDWELGLFAGYSKLMGSDKNYTSLRGYNRNDDINYIYRISPRVTYKQENLALSLEYMLTTAVYGETFDAHHKVTSSLDPVSNNRVTLSAKYNF